MKNGCTLRNRTLRAFALGLLFMCSILLVGCGNSTTTNPPIVKTTTKSDNTTIPISTKPVEKEDIAKEFATEALYDGRDVEVSKVVWNKDDNVTYLEVEGKPFLYVGTQIRLDALRNCDKYDFDYIEKIFLSAKELGVTSLQIPLEWADLEVEEDEWVFDELDNILYLALKCDIKIELLWFGTNMCGESHSYSIPDYILRDGIKYTKLNASRIGEFWNYYGIMWYMDFSDDDLIERETNAIKIVMDYIYNWDSTHGAHKPVIGIQVLNETDIFMRWRNISRQVTLPNGNSIPTKDAWDMVCKSLDALGKEVKKSKYKVYTRTNFASLLGSDEIGSQTKIFDGNALGYLPDWVERIYNLEGIDIVGDDIYSSVVKNCSGMVRLLKDKLPGNFGHLPENAGDYSNQAYIVLATVASGGGMSIYDYLTSPFYIRHRTSNGVDQGITYIDESTMEIVKRQQYDETKKIINALRNCGYYPSTVSENDFAVFNLKGNNPESSINQTVQTTKVRFTYSTSEKSYGFSITTDDYALIYSSGKATIELSNITLSSIEKGYYDSENNWVKTGDVELSNTISLDGESIYRVKIDNISSVLTSTTMNNLG